MVYGSVHGADDWCWHVPFALWVHGNELASSDHELHVKMHPFQATWYPAGRLVLGTFGKLHWVEMMHYGVCPHPWS